MQNKTILYQNQGGNVSINVVYKDETFWLTQKAIAELLGIEIPAASKHLADIYESGELHQEATVSILETVRQEGERTVKRQLEYYNLDTVIAVGYILYETAIKKAA